MRFALSFCFLCFRILCAHAVDVYEGNNLRIVAERVARGKEIILFSFGHETNDVLQRMWLRMTVAFLENLGDFGYRHVLALAFVAPPSTLASRVRVSS